MASFASLILLSYKRPAFLQRTLESLWANTEFPYELIVVDDGSRDECWPYLMQLLEAKKVSTVIFNAGLNMGIGTGVNRGFATASGDYLVKLDSDLEFKAGWLTRGVQILTAFPEIWALGFFRYHLDPVDHKKMHLEFRHKEGLSVEIVRDFVSSAMMLRRDTYWDLGRFPEHDSAFAEDIIFKSRIRERGGLLGLTMQDWIHNFGFGIPHSVVVKPDMTVTPVHDSPLVFSKT